MHTPGQHKIPSWHQLRLKATTAHPGQLTKHLWNFGSEAATCLLRAATVIQEVSHVEHVPGSKIPSLFPSLCEQRGGTSPILALA